MWNWDQGRLDYFQFDELRKIAKFAVKHDLKAVDVDDMSKATGLPFLPNKPGYKPWRNYSRTFKLMMLATSSGTSSKPTPLAKLLAEDGKITTDEFFHFLAEATTDPSPALSGWDNTVAPRYPLLFALKYVLTRANEGLLTTDISAIVAAYAASGFVGDEDQTAYLGIARKAYAPIQGQRQANESIRVLSQISYLSTNRTSVTVSLDEKDSLELFEQLSPVGGTRLADGDAEIQRITALYGNAIADLVFEYPNTVLSDTEEAGFVEGGRVQKTHLTIERNAKIRQAFFVANPSPVCDFCGTNTEESYPWATRILDIHHLLPLCSGARTNAKGTILDDLVANCPTCHRAVHRYYDMWMKKNKKKDFEDAGQARAVYGEAKKAYEGT
ncbi:HNH endonuclease [Mesorhizobium sp. B2-4-19]|uniref:HNH endonuclease n=1 Tax=Mesorhizobium sp. B2-4-19 TaxID=2589930 RepID=UPI0011291E44|nr:HNH endonuclease [Mesorhizobium sp. B2-4-19]TPK60562.1 HNH endonuclease [Mesorhizobium sp. B2-4-19]